MGPVADGAPAGDTADGATAPSKPPSKLRSPEDGAFDMSGFLDEKYGFIPLLTPITEPAVGYGAALSLVFIDKPFGKATEPGMGRPNVTAAGILGTDNGSRGAFAGDMRHWGDDRIQTIVGGVYGSFNLDFYGSGEDSLLKDHPLSYTLEPTGGGVRGRYRFGATRLWAGLSYALADTRITYDEDARLPAVLGLPERSRVGGVIPSVAYDSRDNLFTPDTGTYFEGTAGLFSPTLGGDDTFQRVGLLYIGYWSLHPRVHLGVKGSATFAFGETPFYMLPYVSLRGAPVMRYQGEETADVETEVRWQCVGRWSVVGFLGGGMAWNDFELIDNTTSVVTGGAGFRYELARKYGIHAGADVAYGRDGAALYVVLGSAWARP